MEPFDSRKTQAIFMLLAGETYVTVAKTVGVCSKTVRRWVDEPEFAAELERESLAVLSVARAQSRVQIGLTVERGLVATRFLSQLMNTDEVPLNMRKQAAGQLMNTSIKVSM